MSIPMARCWATRTCSPRSTCAASTIPRAAWAPITWISSYAEGGRLLARQPALPHLLIGAFDGARGLVGVEQVTGGAILRQLVAQRLRRLGIGRELDRHRFIRRRIFGDQFGQAGCRQ